MKIDAAREIGRLSAIGALVILIYSCSRETSMSSAPDPDAALFAETTASGYTFYQGGNTLTGMGPHGNFKLRFNATAAAVLDGTGELPPGNSFPTGSVLVKDIQGGSGITLYAVMKKDPANSNAGSGWLWAEYNPSGGVVVSVKSKGSGCVSCHSTSPNRDLVRTFDLH
ncbi:MAG: cytochrome P460 family protein [Cytophagales bacterium]|nr:cytochrome P460 family protein [Cytophagales bacterium]